MTEQEKRDLEPSVELMKSLREGGLITPAEEKAIRDKLTCFECGKPFKNSRGLKAHYLSHRAMWRARNEAEKAQEPAK